MVPHHTTPPSAEDIASLAETALCALPEELRVSVRNLAIAVEEVPDDETLEEMGLEHPWELTGLYRGVPLTERSTGDLPREPDMITLYREPILVEWVETGEDLFRLVRNVIIHEVGHHFGFSDEEIARLEGEGDEAAPG
ncbi:Acetylglutamate kinase [Roseomonas mucosa]|jgi:predicted Zn-dependent protease with MMP-like domain|uniref:Acetylglutamate kinase n=1 Tax=Roseomonas mucosa TaxID=207340 RepID=A0A1S8DBH9_9PROT|nr:MULTISPECIES: metallopeptidase family protein [Roseomonas]MBS5903475.1 metallopeptidase family protein [Acetobacteraceae bacterium]MDT8265482.1 metallopeptidase family protein [Roseomonas sp. DSM 102946]ATR20875.1 acetylglutamate kinase [Roseomonas sp. FDAARGOS_362]AWV22575.1 Acetylglutamate kinase [Roseomonas mucosa]MCG7350316.1 metallopeptidase family protein [Roseomonas mucosa]